MHISSPLVLAVLLVGSCACHPRPSAVEPDPQPPSTIAEEDYLALARQSADQLIHATDLPLTWELQFLGTTEIRDKIIVEYKKKLLPPDTAIEFPDTVRILYDKKTGTSKFFKGE